MSKYQELLKKRMSVEDEDYDMKKYKEGNKVNSSGHFPDTYKKPNHPTFSKESINYVPGTTTAGDWKGNEFTPGRQQIDTEYKKRKLQRYFNEVEFPDALNIPNSKKLSKK